MKKVFKWPLILLWILLWFIIIMAIFIITVAPNSTFWLWFWKLNTTDDTNIKQEIPIRCTYEIKETIRNQYKSPSTVDFVECKTVPNWWVTWYADAQNSFWATIRSSFLCNRDWKECTILEQ